MVMMIWGAVGQAFMTKYSEDDYKWVKVTVAKHPSGMSVRDIEKISSRESKRLGNRPRDEKPPGRDKIYQIVMDGKDRDWTYIRGGGKGKTSEVKPVKEDQMSVLGDAIRGIQISEKVKKLDKMYKRRRRRLELEEIVALFRIKEAILSYPMNVALTGLKQHKNPKALSEKSLGIVMTQIERIAEIELCQEDRNAEFSTIMQSLKQIQDSDLLEAEIYKDRKSYKGFLLPRNTIRRIDWKYPFGSNWLDA